MRITPRSHTLPNNGRTPAEWNRFDICEAWYLFAAGSHQGQGSDGYAVFGRLDRMRFRPSPMLSRRRLSANGRLILATLIRKARVR